MAYLKILLLVVAGLVIIGLAVFVGGVLLAYDWRQDHSDATLALPSLQEAADGLVRIETGDSEFHARIANHGALRPGVIMLHGFPETSAMWSALIEPVAARGYPVIAFDQRGYSPGARPEDVEAYRIDLLIRDVIDVADAASFRTFHLIGHDWGSAVGWLTAEQYPDRVISWTGMSVPHPRAFGAALQDDPDQQARSTYMQLFRKRWLPELMFAFNNHKMLRGIYRSMPEAQREDYLQVFSEPGAMTAALNWYRAMGDLRGAASAVTRFATPVLFIWGNRDSAVGRKGVALQRAFMPDDYTEIELDTSHWIIQEAPDRVLDEVLGFLDAH